MPNQTNLPGNPVSPGGGCSFGERRKPRGQEEERRYGRHRQIIPSGLFTQGGERARIFVTGLVAAPAQVWGKSNHSRPKCTYDAKVDEHTDQLSIYQYDYSILPGEYLLIIMKMNTSYLISSSNNVIGV